jgi:hypothetical protein
LVRLNESSRTTGAMIQGFDGTDSNTWRRTNPGDRILVYYLPDTPGTNHLELIQAAADYGNWVFFLIDVILIGWTLALPAMIQSYKKPGRRFFRSRSDF